jgi:hypothetical protein
MTELRRAALAASQAASLRQDDPANIQLEIEEHD